jgi:hypothetical protein
MSEQNLVHVGPWTCACGAVLKVSCERITAAGGSQPYVRCPSCKKAQDIPGKAVEYFRIEPSGWDYSLALDH